MIRIYIGIDVHNGSEYVKGLGNDGNIVEQYEFDNSEVSWKSFKERYLSLNPEIALEVSISGKYFARLLRDMGFHVHMADPSRI